MVLQDLIEKWFPPGKFHNIGDVYHWTHEGADYTIQHHG